MQHAKLPALLFILLVASSDASPLGRLPPSAKACLQTGLHTDAIGDIQEVTYRRISNFDYLGLLCEYSRSWTSSQRGRFVLRKPHSEPNWSKAVIFAPDVDIPRLFRLPSRQFRLEVERPLPPGT
jgi:hypothetical protein